MKLGLALLLVAVAMPVMMLATRVRLIVTDGDLRWLIGGPPSTPAAARLAVRYLQRIRVHRRVGAAVGAGMAVVVGLSTTHRVFIGISPDSPVGELLFGTLAGLLVGSVLAELYRIRPSGPARRASLQVRREAEAVTSIRPAIYALTAVTAGLALASHSWHSAALAALAVIVALTQWLTVRAVVHRRRPVLPDDLLRADDGIRNFATRRLAVEALAAAVLLLGWQVIAVDLLPDIPATIAALAAWITTVVLVVRSRPYPPRRLR